MGRESRRAARRAVTGTVQVTNTITEDVIGRIGNVSATGMLLIASGPVVEDGLYQFRFQLPMPSGAPLSVEVGAHVLWVDSASAPGQSWAGVRFIGVPAQTTNLLRQWCEVGPAA